MILNPIGTCKPNAFILQGGSSHLVRLCNVVAVQTAYPTKSCTRWTLLAATYTWDKTLRGWLEKDFHKSRNIKDRLAYETKLMQRKREGLYIFFLNFFFCSIFQVSIGGNEKRLNKKTELMKLVKRNKENIFLHSLGDIKSQRNYLLSLYECLYWIFL